MEDIQALYVALLGRPADPEGLRFFQGATKGAQDYSALAAITSSDEYQARFRGQEFDDLDHLGGDYAAMLYRSMFNRIISPDERDYWVARVNSGESTKESIALDILGGAKGTDAAQYDVKVVAAMKLTALLDTPDEIAAYQGREAVVFGQGLLKMYGVGYEPDNQPIEPHWNGFYQQDFV